MSRPFSTASHTHAERHRRADRVDAVAIARVVARGDELEVVVEEVRAEADDRLVVRAADVGEAARLDLDDALARHRAVAARQLLGDVLVDRPRRRASSPLLREREVARADARPVLDRRVAVLDATARPRAVVPRCDHSRRIDAVGDCSFMPSRVISRYIQPSQLFGLAMYAKNARDEAEVASCTRR